MSKGVVTRQRAAKPLPKVRSQRKGFTSLQERFAENLMRLTERLQARLDATRGIIEHSIAGDLPAGMFIAASGLAGELQRTIDEIDELRA